MSYEDLEHLLTPDFEAEVVASTPRVLRLRLRRSRTIRELRKRYEQGALPGESFRRFVNDLLRDHTDPDSFPYQTALAAIAVVLEDGYSLFSEAYLRDLARVKTGRLSTASRVARLCLAGRSKRTRNETRVFLLETEIQPKFEARVVSGSGHSCWNVPAPRGSTLEMQVY